MTGHPSHYAVDRAALGAPVEPEIVAHLSRCARCAGLVAERRAVQTVPSWARSVKVQPPAARPRDRRWWSWILPVPALAAIALALVISLPPRGRQVDPTRPKGSPQVTVYVKRGDAVSAWDGRTPLHAGDRLRVGIRGAGYDHLSIASLSGSPDAPVLLYHGPLEPQGETLLPLSFRIDERGSGEVLSIVLATRPIQALEHKAPRAPGIWSIRLQIPKEITR